MLSSVFIGNSFFFALAEMPDEAKGLEMLSNVNSFGVLEPKLPATLTNQVNWEK